MVNNNTNDKQTSGISGALDEDSPYINLYLFTLDRLPLLLLLRKNYTSAVQKRHSKVYGNPIAPSFYSIHLAFNRSSMFIAQCTYCTQMVGNTGFYLFMFIQ